MWGICLSSQVAQAQDSTTFYSKASGAWDDPSVWTTRGDETDRDGLPDEDDQVYVMAAHTITPRPNTNPKAYAVDIYGTLRFPVVEAGAQGVRFDLYRFAVRGGGKLEVPGPHEIILTGGEQSQIGSRVGGELELRGAVKVSESTVTRVVEETLRGLVLQDQGQNWRPGELVGQTLKLLSGRSRLWSFTIIANTEDTVTLEPGSLGSPELKADLGFTVDRVDRRVLRAPSSLLDWSTRPYKDRLWRGHWLKWLDAQGQTKLGYVTGATDGGGTQEDVLVVWPPVGQVDSQARWSSTDGLEPGGSYTIFDPVVISIPEANRLPARPSGEWGILLYLSRQTRSVLEHVSLGYGFLQMEGLDATEPDTSLSLNHMDIYHADPGCFVIARDVKGLDLRGMHLRDVHPDSDLLEYGGRWMVTQQRGHGLCVYGSDMVIEDNLVTNVNDDMLYFSQISEARIVNNIALNSGIFHGNTFENITLFGVLGDLELRGNIAMGAASQLLVEERVPGALVEIEDNILSQELPRGVFNDRGPVEASTLLLRNNVLFGGAFGAAKAVVQGYPSILEGNMLVRVSLDGAPEATHNVFLDLSGDSTPLVREPGVLEDNLLVKPSLPLGAALVNRRDPSALTTDSRIRHNTFATGQGAAIHFTTASLNPGRSALVEDNLTQGTFMSVDSRERNPGNVNLVFRNNYATQSLLEGEGWITSFMDPESTVRPVVWNDREQYTLSPGSWAATASQLGGPVGYSEVGLVAPERLPVPLDGLAVRRSSVSESVNLFPSGTDGGGEGFSTRSAPSYSPTGCQCSAVRPRHGVAWGVWALGLFVFSGVLRFRKIFPSIFFR